MRNHPKKKKKRKTFPIFSATLFHIARQDNHRSYKCFCFSLNYMKCLLVKADGSKKDEVPHFMQGQIEFCSDFLSKDIENISNEIRHTSLQSSS